MKFLIAFTLFWISAGATPLRIDGRIRNGVDAFPGEFPYMVYIETIIEDGVLKCGGALISSRWVLTAAHCVDRSDDGNIIKVYLGATYSDDAEVSYVVWSPTVVRTPPLWDRVTADYDIALIEIPETVPCTKIEPIPLPSLNPTTPQTYEGETGIASGWGRTSDSSGPSIRLQCGRMRIARDEVCEDFNPWFDDTEMCIDTSIDLASTCVGDSGGPFILESTGELVGIISYGLTESCENGDPVVFTRVTHYLHWIRSVTGISY